MNLKRTLGLFPATNIVIANMIGAGIFTTSGLLLAGLHDPKLMILLWIIGGVIALCGALSYGELGASMPEPGGEYLFLSRIFHPMFGFLSGWVSFLVGFSAPIAASAIGFSEYFIRAFPGLSGFFLNNLDISQTVLQKSFSVIIVLVFALIHFKGIEFGAKVQNVLTILKVLLIVGLISAIMFSGRGDVANFTIEKEAGNTVGLKTIGLSLMWIMFAYSGWNASTYIGSEIKNPSRNLPFSLLLGTAIVMILYVLLNVSFVYSTSPEKMKGVISVGGMAIGSLFGNSADRVFSLLISFALFSSLSAFMIIGPRVYYSMARDGLFFKSVAKINPVTNVPAVAIFLQALMAIIFIVSGTFEQILTYMGFSLGIFPILTIIGSIKLRLKGDIKVKMPGFPLTQIIYLVTGVTILILSFMERPVESSIALATLAAGVPAFYIFKKYNSTSP